MSDQIREILGHSIEKNVFQSILDGELQEHFHPGQQKNKYSSQHIYPITKHLIQRDQAQQYLLKDQDFAFNQKKQNIQDINIEQKIHLKNDNGTKEKTNKKVKNDAKNEDHIMNQKGSNNTKQTKMARYTKAKYNERDSEYNPKKKINKKQKVKKILTPTMGKSKIQKNGKNIYQFAMPVSHKLLLQIENLLKKQNPNRQTPVNISQILKKTPQKGTKADINTIYSIYEYQKKFEMMFKKKLLFRLLMLAKIKKESKKVYAGKIKSLTILFENKKKELVSPVQMGSDDINRLEKDCSKIQ